MASSLLNLPPEFWKSDQEQYSQAGLGMLGAQNGLAQNAQNAYTQNLYNALQQAQLNTPQQPTPHDRARSLFLARLGGVKGSYKVKPEDFFWCHITSDLRTVHVFFVLGEQAGHTSEDAAMFPSDALVTQFRMIMP